MIMLEETHYLSRGHAGERELGDLLLTEKPDPDGVNLRRRSFLQDLAQKD
jgi:hypothetical protein